MFKVEDYPWLDNIEPGWKVIKLKWTIISCKNGVWGAEPIDDNAIPCLRVADFDREKLVLKETDYTKRQIDEKDLKGRVLKDGDLLLEKSGGGEKQLVGAVVQFRGNYKAVTSNFIARMEPTKNYSSRFLTYLHSYLYSIKVNHRSIKQTTGIQNLDSSQYLNELVSLPELSCQNAIAKFLDYKTNQINNLIEEKERLLKLLEKKRIAIVSQAVTKSLNPNVKLKPSGVVWLGEIPEHWEIKRLKRVVKLVTDKIDIKDFSLPYVGLENIESWTGKYLNNEDFFPEGTANKFLVSDVLFGKLRPYLAKVYHANFIGCCTTEALVMRAGESISSNFLFYFLLSDNVINIINSSTFGSKMPRADWEFIGNIPMVIPPFEEQCRIAEDVKAHFDRIDFLKAQINEVIGKLKEYRTSLITAAVTGKVDVRGFNPERIYEEVH